MNLKKRLDRKGREGYKGRQMLKQWFARTPLSQPFRFTLRSFASFAVKGGF